MALAVILTAGWVRAADAPGGAVRTFTNTAGKTVQAEVVNVDNDTVYLKRVDGKSFQLVIDTLSTADQDYVRDWAVQQALHSGSPIFEISASPERGTTTTSGYYVGWSEGYKVKLSNQSTLHLLSPTIEYIMYNLEVDVTTVRTYGSVPLPEIPANDDTTFTTKPVHVTQYGNGTGEHYVDNKPEGLWVRIYDNKHQLVQEWAEPLDLMKTETWDYPGRHRGAKPPPPDEGSAGTTSAGGSDSGGG
jgi:hypothetical protein